MTILPEHSGRDRTADDRFDRLWCSDTPLIMGVLNCTPDSFSDGGRYFRRDVAVAQGLQLLDDGAHILDVGGESTRPGASAVDAREELRRTIPILSEIRRRRPDSVLSIDTSKADVAAAALDIGVDIVNDVTAGSNPRMLPLVAEHGATVVLMHMRGTPRTMQNDTSYVDVVGEVIHYLNDRARAAGAAGVDPDRVWLDPGIGFGKDDSGNLDLLAAVGTIADLGHPVVIGPSRKSFIGRMTDAGLNDRLPGTLAALQPALGVPKTVVRVHDPGPVRQYLTIARALRRGAG